MREDTPTQLRRATGEFARTAVLPPSHVIRARGDRRRRHRALGSGLLALAVLAGGGAAAFAVVRQPTAPPTLVSPTGTPTASPSQRATPSPSASARSTVAAMLPAGQVGPRSAVPWTRVGPGWELVEYSKYRPGTPGGFPDRPTLLYLIDPEGGRYEMYQWAAGVPAPGLIDWSGDGARALLASPAGPPEMEQLTLATGLITHFTVSQSGQQLAATPAYTRPDGTNLLETSHSAGSPQGSVERFDLTGALAATLVTGKLVGNPIASPDGVVVAVGTDTGVEVVSNAGGGARLLPVPGVDSLVGCVAARWWNSSTVLASCQPQGAHSQQLWLVPADGAAPAALTRAVPPGSPAVYYWSAWRLPSGVYVQASTPACGSGWIGRRAADGSVTRVNVPGASAAVVLAVNGGRMLVGSPGCGADRSLLWFDPATGVAQTVLSTPRGEVGAKFVVPYGGLNG